MRKIEKIIAFSLAKFFSMIKPSISTKILSFFYQRWGMILHGKPNYISSKTWFDGGNYSLIELGEGVTISSNIRILTHDWAPYTVVKSLGIFPDKPVGRFGKCIIGDYSFIGTNSVLMPGVEIGKGCIIGAGTVVRGKIPDHSIVIGNPGKIIGNTKDYLNKRMPEIFE